MSIVPVSHISLSECSFLGNNTLAEALRDRRDQHRIVESRGNRRRWRFRPARRIGKVVTSRVS